MNSLPSILAHPFAILLALALFHFLWQGVVIAALLALALRHYPSKRATERHALACCALLLMAVAPLLTAAWLAAQQLPVLRVELAAERLLPGDGVLPGASGPQVLVLTDLADQATLDLALHALAAHPAVAGPVLSLRVEMLEG